jgi:hypothetical protein
MRIASALAVLALVLASRASAQSVDAEVLFRDGKKLIKAGKLAEGCDKLDASARIEPSVGTLLNLGDCREKLGQHATAWATFQKAAAAAKAANDPKREAEARRREKLLDDKLSYLTITVPDGSKVPGLAIARNGTALDPALWNQSIPVDPGDYDITADAPGAQHWKRHQHVDAGGFRGTVEIPKLGGGSAGPAPGPVVEAKQEHGEPVPESPPEPSHPMTNMRRVAIATAITGGVVIGVGAYLGSHATDLENQADAVCPTSNCSDHHAVDLNSDARSNALYANIAFGVGGAAIAGAVVMWFVGGPSNVTVAPSAGSEHAGVSVIGRF